MERRNKKLLMVFALVGVLCAHSVILPRGGRSGGGGHGGGHGGHGGGGRGGHGHHDGRGGRGGRGGYGRGGYGRGYGRGRYGRYGYGRGSGYGGSWWEGPGVGFSVGVGVGVGTAAYWNRWPRYYYSSYYAPYWGPSGAWLAADRDWQSPRGPQVFNRTGQRIKFYVTEPSGNEYTLTVVTEDGQTQSFSNVVGDVDVISDDQGNLNIEPRYGG